MCTTQVCWLNIETKRLFIDELQGIEQTSIAKLRLAVILSSSHCKEVLSSLWWIHIPSRYWWSSHFSKWINGHIHSLCGRRTHKRVISTVSWYVELRSLSLWRCVKFLDP